jgi:two-component system, OmpR family, response regulator RegX3
MTARQQRDLPHRDRRQVPRGGRRSTDIPGRYPPLLVADNEESVRRPCVRYLSLFGFQVEEAANGEEALAAWDAVRPHVVVTDARLPRSSELTPRLALEADVPFIVTVTDDAAPVPPGARAVLFKPFSLETMLAEVRRALADRQTRIGIVPRT